MIIRPLAPGDQASWQALYRGYCHFYKVNPAQENFSVLWGWLMDKEHTVRGLVVEIEDELVALAHYRASPSPLRGCYVGFLDDLFVSSDFRNRGLGKALIQVVVDAARKEGWPLVRWITADNNIRAHALYDRVAVKTRWNTYEIITSDQERGLGGATD